MRTVPASIGYNQMRDGIKYNVDIDESWFRTLLNRKALETKYQRHTEVEVSMKTEI